MSKKRIIVVLGMHRSGTSAIARSLRTLSVELGDNLMPGTKGENEKGFWEDLDLYEFNEKLLAKSQSAWDRLTPLEAASFSQDDFAAERYEATALIARKLSKSSVFGFKDPRTSILLPFWQCVFEDLDIEDSYVLAVRNPLEVAASLNKRNQLEPEFALALWLKYTWAGIIHSSGRKRVCVSYANLMDDAATQLGRIAAALDLPSPSASNPSVQEFVGEFLSSDLRRNRIPDRELERSSRIPNEVQELYAVLLDWAERDAPAEIPTKLRKQVSNYFTTSKSLLHLSDNLKAAARQSEAESAEIRTSQEQLRGDLAAHSANWAELDASNASLRSELAELRGHLDMRNLRVKELENAESTNENNLNQLRIQIAEATSRANDFERLELEARAGEVAARKDLSNLRAEMEHLARQLGERDQQIALLENGRTRTSTELLDLRTQLRSASDSILAHREALTQAERNVEQLVEELKQKSTALRLARNQLLEMPRGLQAAEAESRAQLASAKLELDAAGQQLDAMSGRNETEEQSSEARQRLASALSELMDREKSHARLSKEFERQKTDLQTADARLKAFASLEARAKNAEGALAGKTAAMAELNSMLVDSQELLRVHRAKSTEHAIALRLLRHEVLALRSSTSWKLTKPFRALKLRLTRLREVFIGLIAKRNLGSPSD